MGHAVALQGSGETYSLTITSNYDFTVTKLTK